MNAEVMFNFLERFTNTVKIDYCLGACKLIMAQWKENSPDEFKRLHQIWEDTIRERFELNVNELEKMEPMKDEDKKILYTFLENLIKEINSI